MFPILIKIHHSGRHSNKMIKLSFRLLNIQPVCTNRRNFFHNLRKWKIGASIINNHKINLRQINSGQNEADLTSVQIRNLEKVFNRKGITRNKYNSVSSKLIEAYVRQCQFEKVDNVIKLTRNFNKSFAVEPTVVKCYVDQCISNNFIKKAQHFLDEEVNKSPRGKAFASTFIDISIAMAERGWHEEALNTLRRMAPANVLTRRAGWWGDASRLLNHYVEKGDDKRLQGDVQISKPRCGNTEK